MILAGKPRQASRVHDVAAAVASATATLPSVGFWADADGARVLVANMFAAVEWHRRFPNGTIRAGALDVPLHICTEGDVEGGDR